MKKNILTISIIGGVVYSIYSVFFPSSPSSLGKEVCECYKEAKSYSNPDKKIQKLEYCSNLMRDNFSTLQQRGIDKDWSFIMIEKSQKEFDKELENCN